jgi:phospholipase/lecithinase/hemolysin
VVPEVTAQGPDKMQAVTKLVTMHNAKLKKMIAEMQEKNPKAKLIYADITGYFNDVYHNPDKYNIKNVNTPCYTGDYSLRSLINNREISAAKEQNIDIMNNPSLRTAYLTAKLAESGAEACDAPDEYMFWDQIHPTRVVHNLMAFDAMNILAENDIQSANSSRK